MRARSSLALVAVTLTSPAFADPPKKAPAPDPDDAAADGADAIERAADATAPGLPRANDRLTRVPLSLSLLAWTGVSGSVAEKGIGAMVIVPLDVLTAGGHEWPKLVLASSVVPIAPPPEAERAVTTTTVESPVLPPQKLQRLVAAAWHAAGLDPEEQRLEDLAHRARVSAALPELRLKAVWSNDASLRLTPTDADPYRIESGDGSGMLYEARATWRLDRIVFADDEVALERLRIERNEQRLRLTLHVIESVAAWQRAHLRAIDPATPPAERADAVVREVTSAAALDVLTAGAWSRRDEETPRAK